MFEKEHPIKLKYCHWFRRAQPAATAITCFPRRHGGDVVSGQPSRMALLFPANGAKVRVGMPFRPFRDRYSGVLVTLP